MTRKSVAKPRSPEADELPVEGERRRGRGACSNSSGRFEPAARQSFDDGWDSMADLEPFRTEVRIEKARSIIATNDSPDIGFDQSINVYRGCEHGCIYCYARPTHCYLGLSAGLDFESVLIAKTNAAELLEQELGKRSYRVEMIALGTNTDPYQPIERRYELTRQILQLLDRTSHPVGIVTKSASILRDIDILASLARRDLVKVNLSVTTLDGRLARKMEPRASTPERRLEAIAKLNQAGIPTGVMVAPVLPAINDGEIEAILQRAHAAGAREAAYVLLRLPLEISALFQEWLGEEFPDRAGRVMKLLRSTRGGKDYVSNWRERQVGTGAYAELIGQRFRIATKRLGMNAQRFKLRTDLFMPPLGDATQFDLFKSA